MYGFIALVFFVVMVLAILVCDKVDQIEGESGFLRDFYYGSWDLVEKVGFTCIVLIILAFISILWLPLICLLIVVAIGYLLYKVIKKPVGCLVGFIAQIVHKKIKKVVDN